MSKAKYYVGYKGVEATTFRSWEEPTQASHGHLYNATVGPFRTKRGAEFMRLFGRNNPHCQTVAQAEALGKAEAAKRGQVGRVNFTDKGRTYYAAGYYESGDRTKLKMGPVRKTAKSTVIDFTGMGRELKVLVELKISKITELTDTVS